MKSLFKRLLASRLLRGVLYAYLAERIEKKLINSDNPFKRHTGEAVFDVLEELLDR